MSKQEVEEAEQIVREYDPYKTLDDCDFNIEYTDPTNGEIAWKIRADEVNWKADEVNLDQVNQSIPRNKLYQIGHKSCIF